jgi:DNA-binding NarL/FixJ family response regulator
MMVSNCEQARTGKVPTVALVRIQNGAESVRPFVLSPRQQQIVNLLLQGCSNAEIARVLKMNRRTVKAHFSRLFLHFGICDGIKRVKLATLLYRSQLMLESYAADAHTCPQSLRASSREV